MTTTTAHTAVEQHQYPVPLAHLALLILWLVPLWVEIPPNLSVILHACLTVYIGCWRSVKPTEPPTESMTKKDAMRFPIVGSAVLFSLFLVFKFLPKDIVNAVLTAYFVFLGLLALTGVLLPFLEPFIPERIRSKAFSVKDVKLPFVKETLDFEVSLPQLIVGALASPLCVWYFFGKHFLASNLLGIAFSIEGIEHLSLGSIQTGVILLSGLFFYDIFWVFCTPVMVSVAKSFDAPIKLLFPRGFTETGARNFAMLGLGDIVIPGIFVALLLRYDVAKGAQRHYFAATYLGYTLGLTATIVVMNVFKAAQPALLYIVPAVLGAVFLMAAVKKQVHEIYHYTEVDEPADTATQSESEDQQSQQNKEIVADKKTD